MAAKKLKDVLSENSELLFALNNAGIKNIQTALDYMSIYNLEKSLHYIPSKVERKNRIADQMAISKRTVDSAMCAMEKLIKIEE